MNLIRLLQTDEDIGVIASEFSSHPQLTVNLLKYMNSSAFFVSNEISSISHAIKLLGRLPLAQWLTLYLYASGDDNIETDPIFNMALFRARTMSSLAIYFKMDKKKSQKAYLVGMASLFDVILGVSFEEIFEEIKFDEEIKEAVIQRENSIGKLLKMALIIESGDTKKIEAMCGKVNISLAELAEILFSNQKELP